MTKTDRFAERAANYIDIIADRFKRALALAHLHRGHSANRRHDLAKFVERADLCGHLLRSRHSGYLASAVVSAPGFNRATNSVINCRRAARVASSSSPVALILSISATPRSSSHSGSD